MNKYFKFRKIIPLLMVLILLLNVIYYQVKIFAEETDDGSVATETLGENAIFTNIDENGNVIEVSDDELNQSGIIESNKLKYYRSARSVSIENGVVNFRTKDASVNTKYTELNSGRDGYINGTYGADAAYIGHNDDGSKVYFMMAGVIGAVSKNDVEVLSYDDNRVQKFSEYYVSDGRLYHGIVTNLKNSDYSSRLDCGPKPSYLKEGASYFSYDGHYFYLDDGSDNGYVKMLKDYRNNTRANSINPNNPYYNYYQYLPHRSKTIYTADDINKYLNYKTKSSSKMRGMGSAFISNQDKYGVNALLMIGVAANESAWGTSQIAQNKNNLFGHSAYDSDPSGSSNAYSTPAFSIYYHASTFLSKGYCNPNDWRYGGSFLGDKASGVGVKYASDPYWAEKAAAHIWGMDSWLGGKDSYKYTLGIKDPLNYHFTNSAIRNSSSNSGTELYRTINRNGGKYVISNYAFINLDNYSNNGYYKIQTDATLNSTRTAILKQEEYSFSNSYGYIESKNTIILQKGSNSSTADTTYLKGDVNGDGKVSTLDYIAIENHIMNRSRLTGDKITRADVNGDGKVSTLDYIAIENHIMGRKPLF
ncbi:glucosaminidase domain-containing protein [Candidatus Stoquefichus massiliensis]|uniref:glucosaminidase domain-containing protein n=1 Tax=Candidatus Stoquefichus massiliensis TaxID=1470350 RepID=UPI0004AD2568|nr:glucosaminidase domain-containing protein [Candidatus Stoquefichus massiliensis]